MRRPDEPSERLRRILDGVEDARATDPDLPDEGTRDGPVPQPPRPLTLPSSIATARWRVRPRAVVGVGLLLAVAVTVLGVRLHLAQRDALPQAAAPATSGGPAVVASGDRSGFETGVGTEPAPSGTAPAGAPPAAEVYVHVVGRVRSPGVITVPAGARVEEAIKGAGGVREGADLAQVNLARPVVDGEQVVVPREGGATPVAGGVPAPAGPTAPGAPGGPSGTAGPSAPVDLNTADQATLETLPGVGPVLAARIVEWRTTNGGFTTVEELDEVSGIGEKLYAQISPKVTV